MDHALLFALIGGIVPALIWLVLWLRIDCVHTEPLRMVMISFALGMLAVPIVYPIQGFIFEHVTFKELTLLTLLLWAASEEILKYLAARFAIHSYAYDEPIDAIIYMISAALGFAALENTFFIVGPLISNDLFQGFMTGNLRIFGASLLHVLSSATVGACIAYTYYKKYFGKVLGLIVGLILAIVLHTTFNFFIIKANGYSLFIIFAGVWSPLIFLVLIAKRIRRFSKKK